jgi:hypothetical protein
MPTFAKVKSGVVVAVVVATKREILERDDFDAWVQTSFNTAGGIHYQNGEPLRENFAGIGYSYDSVLDVFVPPECGPGVMAGQG